MKKQHKQTTVHDYDTLAARRANPYWDKRNELKAQNSGKGKAAGTPLTKLLSPAQLKELDRLLAHGRAGRDGA